MSKTYIGMSVWYFPHKKDDFIAHDKILPLAATVCYVHEEFKVNLSILDMYGSTHVAGNVLLLRHGEELRSGGYATLPSHK
jgi:hypothetical protein